MGINNLIARFLADKTTREEWEQLESWKTESKENLKELMELKSIWSDTVDLKDYKEYDQNSAWNTINAQLEDSPLSRTETKTRSNTRFLNLKWTAGIAAAIAILIFAVVSVNNSSIEGYNSIASNDTVETVELPDGSNIVLNKNTDLNYATDFGSNRSIILDGEAYFDVARDEERPFSILTDCGKVTVLGTSFNIEENEDYVDVLVTSGSVKVQSGDEEVILTKNEMVRCGGEGITKRELPGSNYLSWKTNKLIFNDLPLHLAIADISRHFNVNLAFSGESKAMNLRIDDEFENQDFDSVMESIVLITGIKYIKEGKKYVIQ